MSSSPERPLKILLRLPSSHPQLLEGLDLWLRLGLLSDFQVKQLCREYLTCEVVLQPQTQTEAQEAVASTTQPEKPLIAYPSLQPKKAPQPNFVTKMLQSLGEELSVRWLLFLGVFLVVLSSGVLAASQWARFPAAAQYGVLFAYTLTFWGLSFWTGKQENLRLTTQTLLIVTLFLVPVNFWAMDSFGLWHNPLNWLTVAIASPILTIITVLLCKNRTVFPNSRNIRLPLINILALSYLHWGWQITVFPLIAVYAAMIGTTVITVYHIRRQQQRTDENQLGLFATVVVYSLILLLSRAIFVAGVNVTQLGLAIGVCGWLITWLVQEAGVQGSRGAGVRGEEEVGETRSREQGRNVPESSSHSPFPTPHSPLNPAWEILGRILLFFGWAVSVISYPEQALAVSGLALWYVSQRLQRYSHNVDLAVFFAIGLQAIWLGWRLVPDEVQKFAIAIATNLTKSQNESWALLSLALFPYLVFMVWFSSNLRRNEKADLANFGEALALLFGSCLTTLSTVNPILRSLNLVFSTITVAVVTQRRSPSSTSLIYFTHVLGLLALFSTIYWFLPSLQNYHWASVVLAVMVAEWVFSLGSGVWQRSAWHIGLGLSIISFALFWDATVNQHYWGVIWLVTPLSLTFLASRTTAQPRIIRSALSLLAIFAVQFLTIISPGTRLIGLAVGTGLMYVNTRYLRNEGAAAFTIGSGLSLVAALLWEGIPGLPNLTIAGWLVVGAIATFSLWLMRKVLQQRHHELADIYAAASDKWAIALCGAVLLSLTVHSYLVYNAIFTPGLPYLVASVITLIAIAYRSWREPTNWAFYGIGWCVELLLAEALGFGERSIIRVAIANIVLGLFTQLLGEWWRRRYHPERLPSSLHILPLVYGAFSVLLRFNTFTESTGLLTLGVALIVIGVGRRHPSFKPLLYFGIIGVSISAYELLFYQMSQAKGGALGDGLIAMSALGASIMLIYSRLSPWLSKYLRLPLQEIKGIAHLHWAWSSVLLMAAITVPIESQRLVGLGTGTLLIMYAILQGRRTADSPLVFGRITTEEMWVYFGLLLLVGMRVYWRETIVGEWLAGPLVPWNGAIACVIAYFLYSLPWENWGWSKKPWQLAAYILPLIILWETRLQVYSITLLIAAGFYIILAKVSENIRVTYISIVLIDWALFNWLYQSYFTDTLWQVTTIGLSILYIAQIDPLFKLSNNKTSRHILRFLGSTVICGWAVLFHQHTVVIPGIFSLIAIFAGLGLRIRAFLYVGTAAFLTTSIYQLVIVSLSYPFLKWVVGLLVGILLIYIAANFETHRTQINSLLRNTSNNFQEWE